MAAFAHGKAKTGGRRKGTPNKGSERARRLISETDDATIVKRIVAQAKVGDPESSRLYFRYLRPPSPRTTGAPVYLEPPKTAEEARGAIARITSMIARAEIDGEHGSRIIAGLQAFLGAKAAELEAEVEKHRAEEEGVSS
jgi:hypothetical protein